MPHRLFEWCDDGFCGRRGRNVMHVTISGRQCDPAIDPARGRGDGLRARLAPGRLLHVFEMERRRGRVDGDRLNCVLTHPGRHGHTIITQLFGNGRDQGNTPELQEYVHIPLDATARGGVEAIPLRYRCSGR